MIRMISICLLLISLAYSTQVCWPYPAPTSVDKVGGQFAFSAIGLNKYAAQFIPKIEVALMTLVIPDIEEHDLDLGFAKVDLSITDIHFDSATLEHLKVSLDDPYISMSFLNSSATVQCEYSYSQTTYPYVEDSGWFTASLIDLSATMSTSIGLDTDCNVLYFDLLPIEMSVEDIDIEFYGGSAWLYDLIAELLSDIFLEFLVDPLADLLHDPLEDTLNHDVATADPIANLGDDNLLDVDFRFTEGAFFGEGGVFGLKVVAMIEPRTERGALMWEQDMPELPLITSDSDAQLYYSMPVFISQFESLRVINKLQSWIKPEDVSSEYTELLTADFLANYIPGLEDYTGNDVSLFLNTTVMPSIVGQPVALFLNLTGDIEVHLVPSSQSRKTNDTLLVTIGVSFGYTMVPSMFVTEQYYGNTTALQLDCNVYNQTAWFEDSKVGPAFDIVDDLSMLIGLVGGATAPYLTDLSRAYSIQIPGNFVNPDEFEFVIRDQYLQVDFNL